MVYINYTRKMAILKHIQRWQIPAVFLFIVIIFMCSSKSSTTTVLSDSVISYDSKVSVVEGSSRVIISLNPPILSSTDTNFAVNFSQESEKTPVSTPDNPPPAADSSKFPSSDHPESEEYLKDSTVEGQMAILRSYTAKSRPSGCDGRGIYVYDLPAKFNKDLLANCPGMAAWFDYCKYLSNDGMGEPLPELGEGWYNTHQYTLEPIFHTRILNHPCRVQNAEDAKLFYVPYYGGHDAIQWYLKKVSNNVRDTLSHQIIEWLELQEPWKRNSGLDHVFVLGKISWDFRRPVNGTAESRLLEFDELYNPMKLLIERQPWHVNDVGVPHPTDFHPKSDEDILALQAELRSVNRKNLISFAGAPRMDPNSIRTILIEQCKAAPDTCKFFDCRKHACVSPVPVVNLFKESEFCLQPTGDSPTRKSVFDSLVAGCIPVLFSPFTAYYQYPWHLPEDYRKYSVYIDQDAISSSEANVVEILTKIPSKTRQEMRRYIIDELMPRLLYSDPTAKLEKFEDAFSIAVNNLLESVARRLPAQMPL